MTELMEERGPELILLQLAAVIGRQPENDVTLAEIAHQARHDQDRPELVLALRRAAFRLPEVIDVELGRVCQKGMLIAHPRAGMGEIGRREKTMARKIGAERNIDRNPSAEPCFDDRDHQINLTFCRGPSK